MTVQRRPGGKVIGGFEGLGSGGRGFFGAGEAPEEADDVPTGMASLDVELPRRGTLFQFTMPRGEAEITAWSAARPLIEGLERVAGVVVLVVMIVLVRRWLRGREIGLKTQGTISTVVIILGVIGVAFGIFPVAGLLALAVGVGMKTKLFFARRRPAAV